MVTCVKLWIRIIHLKAESGEIKRGKNRGESRIRKPATEASADGCSYAALQGMSTQS